MIYLKIYFRNIKKYLLYIIKNLTCIGVKSWSTVIDSLKPCDCTCNLNSGSNFAGHVAPGATGGAHGGIIGSLNANSV